MIDITPILSAVMTLISAVITCVLIPYIRQRTSDAQRQTIAEAVRVAVSAAEQLYGGGQGRAKKAYVVSWLEERGFTVDEAELDALIESTVYRLKEDKL